MEAYYEGGKGPEGAVAPYTDVDGLASVSCTQLLTSWMGNGLLA